MIGTWWVTSTLNAGGPTFLVAWIIWVVVSIMLHELAHGWAAISRGDTTPIDTGHMTWNPLVHMGLGGVFMFAILGIAYGLMPVDPSRMRGKYADAWVAICGPLMNFALAAVCLLGGGVAIAMMSQADFDALRRLSELGNTTSIPARLALFAGVGAGLNIVLGMFNLIPIVPLDGSRILANLSNWYRDFTETDTGKFVSLILFVIAFVFAGNLLVPVAWYIVFFGMGFIGHILRAVGIGP